MQQGQLKSKHSHLSPLARSFSPNASNPRKNIQFLSLASPIDAPNSPDVNDSAAVLAHQRGLLNALRASNLAVPASAPILPGGEDGRNTWGPPERPIEEEKDKEEPTPSTGESSVATPAEQHESWSSMVATPLVSMFPKVPSGTQQTSADGKVPLFHAEGLVPQMGDAAIYRRGQKGAAKKKNMSPGYLPNGPAQPLPTPTGVIPTSPYNLNMLNAMGVSPEAQLLAVQMFVNGYLPAGYVAPQQQQPHAHVGGRWRAQASAGLKSGGSMRSAGIKSASSTGAASGVINRENETDPELLKDIPAWLKALRLHKYAPSFEGLTWKEMVVMDETALEGRGVVTVGARKRFLRLFEAVRKSQGMEEASEESPAVEKEEVVPVSAPVEVAS